MRKRKSVLLEELGRKQETALIGLLRLPQRSMDTQENSRCREVPSAHGSFICPSLTWEPEAPWGHVSPPQTSTTLC